MLEPILLEVKVEVRRRNSLLGSSVVSRIGSVSFDLRDDDIGHDELPQWHQLVTEEGMNAPGMVLLQVKLCFSLFGDAHALADVHDANTRTLARETFSLAFLLHAYVCLRQYISAFLTEAEYR